MNLKSVLRVLTLCTALGAATPNLSWAQGNVGELATPSGIAYIYGGIGSDNKEEMEAIRKDYNFRLTFACPHSGQYLADVKVTVENTKSHEKTMDVASGGPLFFAQLPDGKYNVTAEFEGAQQTKTIAIHKNLPRGIVFYFVSDSCQD
jgi:hypothetical protein